MAYLAGIKNGNAGRLQESGEEEELKKGGHLLKNSLLSVRGTVQKRCVPKTYRGSCGRKDESKGASIPWST